MPGAYLSLDEGKVVLRKRNVCCKILDYIGHLNFYFYLCLNKNLLLLLGNSIVMYVCMYDCKKATDTDHKVKKAVSDEQNNQFQ